MDIKFIQIQDLNIDSEKITKIYNQLTECPKLNNTQISNFKNVLCKNTKIYCMKVNNDIIGFGTIIIEQKITHNLCHVGHIEDIIIDKKFLKKGYGKKLINFLISIGRDNNCYKIILNCLEDNILFYEKCGFKQKNVEMSLYF
jgi:glucosamine-phosphate N-acetyltransferase